ncbi:MAG: hypothetical protein ABSA74_03065 [Candidatus Staskawiczbacteria bacterium]|jgi:hypothetical protein
MAKIKALILKSLLAFSAVLTAWQVKIVNAQIVYMGPPSPGHGSGPSPIPNPTLALGPGGTVAVWSIVAVIFLFALIGLVVVVKYLVGFIIRLLSKKKK